MATELRLKSHGRVIRSADKGLLGICNPNIK